MTIWDTLYRRYGVRYMRVLFTLGVIGIVLLTPVGTAVAVLYGALTLQAFFGVLAVAVPVLAVVGFIGMAAVAWVQAPLFRWVARGGGPEGAEEAWDAAVARIGTAFLYGNSIVIIGALPAAAYGAVQSGLGGPAGIIATCAAVSIVVAVGGMAFYFLWEQATRPVVVEISRYLPHGFRSIRRPTSASTRVLVLLPETNALVGMLAAGVSTDSLGNSGKIAVGVGAGLVISGTIALGLTLLLKTSLMRPLRALQAGIADVERGDLSTRVALTSADELGEVIRNFNAMVEGLEERERLREHNSELAADRSALLDELRASRGRIVASADAERRRMERDLHDGAQQRLVMLQLQLGLLNDRLAQRDVVEPLVGELRANLSGALAELRDLAHGIYPTVLESEGLPAALSEALARAPITGDLVNDCSARFAREIEAAVYFCCLEALQNSAKHAGPDAHVEVTLARRGDELEFAVRDDGRGFVTSASVTGSGLHNMIDRIGALGGNVTIESAPGAGTAVRGRLPAPALASAP